MREYHKIQTIYKRDEKDNFKTLLIGEYSKPEFKYLENNKWVFTEKIDGTNIRVQWDGKAISFAGKTDNAQIPPFLIKKLLDRFNADIMASVFASDNVCLYGEGYGAKIQSGGSYIPDGCDFILFDVLCDGWLLERHNIEDIASKLSINIVPIIGYGTLGEAVIMAQNGFKSLIGSCMAEGIVMRPEVELFCRGGERVITKIKHKDFKHN